MYSKREVAPVIRRLEEAVETLDLNQPLDAVALLATRDSTQFFKLPFTVFEQVVVDETFATRDLVRGLARAHRYRVLVLAEKPARLFEATGDDLVEVRAGGFPLMVEGGRGEPLQSGGYAVHTSPSDEQQRAFFRRVDRALGAAGADDPLPVVVVGVERDLAYFEEVTDHRQLLAARVEGGHERTPPAELAAVIEPAVRSYFDERRSAALARLVEAIGTHRSALGIDEVWRAAHEGRGDTLLVEEDYFAGPSKVVDGRLRLAPTDAPDVLDDPVTRSWRRYSSGTATLCSWSDTRSPNTAESA
jgi:Bacterial archaeo-eukaryotic release factor family 3